MSYDELWVVNYSRGFFGARAADGAMRDRDRFAKFDKPTVKIMFQVTQIVRFLPERGLRFRNLGFCGHDFT